MAKESFLFIPDISGFTEFVNNTEIEHGQHIISELLQNVIDSNSLDMTVSEVEGDAVLFYKHEQVPSFNEIAKQAETIFLNFHNHLQRYEVERICQCGACSTAANLSIKMVAHVGEIGFTTVNNAKKPYGADLVLIHKLLKTGVTENEYIMLSELLFDSLKLDNEALISDGWLPKEETNPNEDDQHSFYYYKSLNPLFEKVTELSPPTLPVKQNNPFVLEIEVNRSRDFVFEMILNLDLRLKWNKSVNDMVYDKDKLNRIGTRHQCLIGGTASDFETITNDFGPDKLVYGERVLDVPFVKDLSAYYILSDHGESTGLRLEVHINSLPLTGWFIKPLIIKRISKAFKENLAILKEICEETPELVYETVN